MDFWTIVLLAAVAYCVLAPPKYDLAIRLKEANIRWAERLAKRRKK